MPPGGARQARAQRAFTSRAIVEGIAWRYRGQKDAQDRLAEIVRSGSGRGGKERHWQGKVRYAGMLPNVEELDEDQARQLVHWILSFAP